VRRLAALAGVVLVASAAVAAAASGPPVIHESFTLLPCPAKTKTTLDLEGCAEKGILATDNAINARVKTIWGLLAGSSRATFAGGEKAWLVYRRSSCAAEASSYTNGSERPVASAECERTRNKNHLKELAEVLAVLRQH
jgi:uncharacterized protein YecT (DUF1311 family)